LTYRGKDKPWEESIHVPFVIRWPAGIPANRQLDTLFSTVDITPTLLSLAGVPVPDQMQGLDLSYVLRGQEGSVPDSALIMAINPGVLPIDHQVGDWRGVRTLDYTYTRRAEEAGVTPWLLYDNQNDPYQMTNLINDPAYSDIQAELDAVLSDWLIRVSPNHVYVPMVWKTVG
jgi:arylsulfatase A-like enzyme